MPLRVNASDAGGPCLKTTCLSEDAALRNLARGNYEVWQRARHPATGITSTGGKFISTRPCIFH